MILRRDFHYYIFSGIVHILIVALLFIMSKLAFNIIGGSSSEETKKLRIIGKAVKVDVVAMPRLTIQELKKLAPAPGELAKPGPKVESKGGDPDTVFKKKVKKASFADMLKNLSKRKTKKAKKVKRKAPVKESGAKGISGKNLTKILALGNKLSEGNSYTGGSGTNTGDAIDTYALNVMETVRRFWRLPGYLANQDLSCRVQVFIGKDGKILKTKLLKSSGNSDYDQRAMNAVKKVKRFSAPEKVIARRMAQGEIVLAFPL